MKKIIFLFSYLILFGAVSFAGELQDKYEIKMEYMYMPKDKIPIDMQDSALLIIDDLKGYYEGRESFIGDLKYYEETLPDNNVDKIYIKQVLSNYKKATSDITNKIGKFEKINISNAAYVNISDDTKRIIAIFNYLTEFNRH